jgi:hypothetical protein
MTKMIECPEEKITVNTETTPTITDYLNFQKFLSLPHRRTRGWLRHCATNLKVAGSIREGVIGIFHCHNPSSCTMILGSTPPLTEMSTRNISCRVKAAGWQTCTFMRRLSWNLGAPNSWSPQSLSRPVQGLFYLLPVTFYLHLHSTVN